MLGKRFYIYEAKGPHPALSRSTGRGDDLASRIWSDDLAVPGKTGAPPKWMLELAQLLIAGELPTGVIVGSAVVEKVTQNDDVFEWHLTGVKRVMNLRKPTGHPQPI